MDNQIALNDIRVIAEGYVKEYIPDEFLYFDLIWDQIEHPLSASACELPKDKTSWLGHFIPHGLAFEDHGQLCLKSLAVFFVLEAVAIELKTAFLSPTEEQVKNGVVRCAIELGIKQSDADQLADRVGAKLHTKIVTCLSGVTEEARASLEAAEPVPVDIGKQPYVFKRYKAKWWVSFGREYGWLDHQIGMSYIHALLNNPRRYLSPNDLCAKAGEKMPLSEEEAKIAEEIDKMSDAGLHQRGMSRASGTSVIREASKGYESDVEYERLRKALDIALKRAIENIRGNKYIDLYAHLMTNIRTDGGKKIYLASDKTVHWLL